MLNIATVRINTAEHEKLVVNDKYGFAKHHYRKDRGKRNTPEALNTDLGRKPAESKADFRWKTTLLESKYSGVEFGIIKE